jgi:hypothetical protein
MSGQRGKRAELPVFYFDDSGSCDATAVHEAAVLKGARLLVSNV